MGNPAAGHAQEIRERHAGGGKWPGNATKILNRGNELKDILKTQDLEFFGAKNELNFERKNDETK